MAVTRWVDCGVCGRTHQDISADCRAFRECAKCGDCYHFANLGDHMRQCMGKALSEDPEAVYADE